MHLHILGVCGTFMAGLATLAKSLGHRVTGADHNAWPPMSEQLRAQGIEVIRGYDPAQLDPRPDLVVIGNALTRGNPVVEHVLDERLPYTSGPAWLAEHLLRERWVLAVSGTHGKTTTSAMLAWILDRAGADPGFLIGGVPLNFDVSARIGGGRYFVIEADEYDTAFFDKRSKFVHYHPRTLVVNNIEHDHVDIFPDLESIIRQFHHLVRIVPRAGCIVHPLGDTAVEDLLARGCWSRTETLGTGGSWSAKPLAVDGSRFEVCHAGRPVAVVDWDLIGEHNVVNALAALAAAAETGVTPEQGADALHGFANVKRRLEVRGQVGGITVYDDFAHHPTAIRTTLAGLRSRVGTQRILALLDPRSNSMRAGLHRNTLASSLAEADKVWLHTPDTLEWDLQAIMHDLGSRAALASTPEGLLEAVVAAARSGDHVLLMSNGDFAGLHGRLLEALAAKRGETDG